MEFEQLRVKEVLGVVRYRPNITCWETKSRKDHIMGLQLSGSAHHAFSDQEFVMSQYDIYFLNQAEDYKVKCFSQTESLSIHFTTEAPIDTQSFCRPTANPEKFLSILQKAEMAVKTQNSLLLYAAVYQFCAEAASVHAKAYAPKDSRMNAARMYMDLHFHERDCLQTVIQKSGVGQRRFGTLFREQFDITPNRYLVTRRIDYAKTLLASNVLSVAEVAERCGFSDVFYFSKTFKKETDRKPSKWK